PSPPLLHQPPDLTSLHTPGAHSEFYALSLHDALPILRPIRWCWVVERKTNRQRPFRRLRPPRSEDKKTKTRRRKRRARLFFLLRSEEHTSELQSRENLVCRLLLEEKNQKDRHDVGEDG